MWNVSDWLHHVMLLGLPSTGAYSSLTSSSCNTLPSFIPGVIINSSLYLRSWVTIISSWYLDHSSSTVSSTVISVNKSLDEFWWLRLVRKIFSPGFSSKKTLSARLWLYPRTKSLKLIPSLAISGHDPGNSRSRDSVPHSSPVILTSGWSTWLPSPSSTTCSVSLRLQLELMIFSKSSLPNTLSTSILTT